MSIFKLYKKLLDFKPFWVVALIISFFLIPFYLIWLLIHKLIVHLRDWDYTDYISKVTSEKWNIR